MTRSGMSSVGRGKPSVLCVCLEVARLNAPLLCFAFVRADVDDQDMDELDAEIAKELGDL